MIKTVVRHLPSLWRQTHRQISAQVYLFTLGHGHSNLVSEFCAARNLYEYRYLFGCQRKIEMSAYKCATVARGNNKALVIVSRFAYPKEKKQWYPTEIDEIPPSQIQFLSSLGELSGSRGMRPIA